MEVRRQRHRPGTVHIPKLGFHLIDDYTRRVWPYFLKNKDDTFATFKNWKVTIERQTERKVKLQE